MKYFPLWIGLRYTRAKKRNHFISFISLVSMLGIALGVTALITVLSVMNGFDRELRERILGMTPAITVTGIDGTISDWPALRTLIQDKIPAIREATPFADAQGLLSYQDKTHFALINGILPEIDNSLHLLREKMVVGTLAVLQPTEFRIILGIDLAKSLGVTLGDKVTLVLPEAAVTPAGVVPRFKRFTVAGLFQVGYEYDSSFAYIHMQDAQTLLRLKDDRVTGLHLAIDDMYAAPRMVTSIANILPPAYMIYDWTRINGNFFQAVKLEKTVMFAMLTLIVAVATFNILSTLVMLVTDKQSDIAILRTLGASPASIMGIFMVQGSIIGAIGTLLGLLGGVTLAFNVTAWVDAIEKYFHVQFLSSDVFYISYLPSYLLWSDVVKICLIALSMSLLASLYPAWRASKTEPAEALRYE